MIKSNFPLVNLDYIYVSYIYIYIYAYIYIFFSEVNNVQYKVVLLCSGDLRLT